MTDIWGSCLHIIKDDVGSRVVETWFKAVEMMRWDSAERIVYLRAPNAFVRDWICNNYTTLLQTHLCRLLHVPQLKVMVVTQQKQESTQIQVDSSLNLVPAVMEKTVPEPQTPAIRAVDGTTVQPVARMNGHMNRFYSFDTFIVGPSNSLSYAAAHAITEKPGSLYNPLFIYGRSGLGKTHLLHAIGNEIKIKHSSAVVLYQPADRFVSEFIHAIRFDKVHKFQAKYQSVDVLLIDDIQFISNKEQTQEAFFHIFNTLYNAHKQIVFSSDTVPHDMSGIAERLRSRLACGLVTDIHMPRLETKIAIVKKKAELSNIDLPDTIAHFIASCAVSNIRELEGALIRVLAFSSLANQPITLELVQRVLSYVEQDKTKTIDLEQIAKGLFSYYPYDLNLMKSKNRSKEVALARHILMYFAKKMTDKSLRDIGMILGGRSHATVMHGIAKVEEQIQADSFFKQHIESIEANLRR